MVEMTKLIMGEDEERNRSREWFYATKDDAQK